VNVIVSRKDPSSKGVSAGHQLCTSMRGTSGSVEGLGEQKGVRVIRCIVGSTCVRGKIA
jgi:hypothetical protein